VIGLSEPLEPPDRPEEKQPAEWPFLVFVLVILALIVAKGLLMAML
jgi:hypothetical protein